MRAAHMAASSGATERVVCEPSWGEAKGQGFSRLSGIRSSGDASRKVAVDVEQLLFARMVGIGAAENEFWIRICGWNTAGHIRFCGARTFRFST
jgi:hypothetical protein